MYIYEFSCLFLNMNDEQDGIQLPALQECVLFMPLWGFALLLPKVEDIWSIYQTQCQHVVQYLLCSGSLCLECGCEELLFQSQVTFPFLSDIVFVRTWYPVSIPTFYNPVTSLLKPAGEKDSWSGMKTTGQLRYERGIKLKQNKDSLYKVYFSFVLFCF